MSTAWGSASPGALAGRFARLVEQFVEDAEAAKAQGRQRALLKAVADAEPATLNQVAAKVKRGAPAVSRAIDVLVRAGFVERTQDPDNRRRLALRLSDAGRERLDAPPVADASLQNRMGKLAHSELRALERGIEILERLPK